jgi:hypothetical protein
VRIHLAAEHALEFQPAHARFQLRRLALDLARGRFVVLALGQVQQLRGIADGGAGAVEVAQLGAEARAFASELLGPIGCSPDAGILQLATDLF